MKTTTAFALILGLAVSSGCTAGPELLAIRNVTVIDGTGAAAKTGMTVVIAQGQISAIGTDGSVDYPSSARVIDGTGKYLIPGLWDMHVHLRDLEETLPLFVINGVTTVRDMGSELQKTVALREQIQAGVLVGPRIKTSGMMVESSSWVAQYVDLMREQGADDQEVEKFLRTRILVGDPDRARVIVDSLTALGADFIKIRHAESPEVFAAIAEAATDAGTHLVGHYVWILSLEESADGGQRGLRVGGLLAKAFHAAILGEQDLAVAPGRDRPLDPAHDQERPRGVDREAPRVRREVGLDHVILQCLTPYPKTEIRESLKEEGLVTNLDDFEQEVTELERLEGSCPFLYTWDGEGFHFVNEVLGGAI